MQAGLPEFLAQLEEYVPTVPDEVTQHSLRLSGYDCRDTHTIRLISLAAQRFAANVANDALQIHKRKKAGSTYRLKGQGYNPKDQRQVLNTEDLAEALQEYGVGVKAAPYWADNPATRPAT